MLSGLTLWQSGIDRFGCVVESPDPDLAVCRCVVGVECKDDVVAKFVGDGHEC